MNSENIERGDRFRLESNRSKYDGHVGVAYQIYDDYLIMQLENADGIVIAAPYDDLVAVSE